VFIGEYTHNIDRKGRLIMPAKFREELGERVYITKGMDGCLNIYTRDEFIQQYKQYSSLPATDENARMFLRIFMSKACEVDLDAQGRVLIPSNLITAAKLDKECYIIGVADRIEVWSKDEWLKLQETVLPEYEKFAEKVSGMLN
jgi:MraZ protein